MPFIVLHYQLAKQKSIESRSLVMYSVFMNMSEEELYEFVAGSLKSAVRLEEYEASKKIRDGVRVVYSELGVYVTILFADLSYISYRTWANDNEVEMEDVCLTSSDLLSGGLISREAYLAYSLVSQKKKKEEKMAAIQQQIKDLQKELESNSGD